MISRYDRAVDIAQFIAEGHTLKQTIEEFRLSGRTISRDLDFLAQYGYGEENKRNIRLYLKAKAQLQRNCHPKHV